jgi:hypothetical protein
VLSLAEERSAFRAVARHPKHGVAMRTRAVEQDREQQSARNLAKVPQRCPKRRPGRRNASCQTKKRSQAWIVVLANVS